MPAGPEVSAAGRSSRLLEPFVSSMSVRASGGMADAPALGAIPGPVCASRSGFDASDAGLCAPLTHDLTRARLPSSHDYQVEGDWWARCRGMRKAWIQQRGDSFVCRVNVHRRTATRRAHRSLGRSDSATVIAARIEQACEQCGNETYARG